MAIKAPAPHAGYMARDAFAELVRKSDPVPDEVLLWKSAPVDPPVVERDADGKETRRVRVAISSGNVDRESDTIALDGWNLDAYQRNPVVLWAHSYSGHPIASSVELTVDPPGARADGDDAGEAERRLWSVDEFVEAGVHPLADLTFSLISMGKLHATSVGFRPLKWMFNEERFGIDFGEQEMLEHSWVPVPANADAVLGAKAAGLDFTPALEWAERLLDEYHGEEGIWIPRSQAGAALEMLGKSDTITIPEGYELHKVGDFTRVAPIGAPPIKVDDDPETKGDPDDDEPSEAEIVAVLSEAIEREMKGHITRLTGRV